MTTERQSAFDLVFMDLALTMGDMSTCARQHVGCVLVLDNRIIATGYNGSLPGMPHCNKKFEKDVTSEEHKPWSYIHEVHAEINAIIDAGLRHTLISGMTAYCSLFPCLDCVRTMLRAGIVRIVYFERQNHGYELDVLKLCEEAGVRCEQHVG